MSRRHSKYEIGDLIFVKPEGLWRVSTEEFVETLYKEEHATVASSLAIVLKIKRWTTIIYYVEFIISEHRLKLNVIESSLLPFFDTIKKLEGVRIDREEQ